MDRVLAIHLGLLGPGFMADWKESMAIQHLGAVSPVANRRVGRCYLIFRVVGMQQIEGWPPISAAVVSEYRLRNPRAGQ